MIFREIEQENEEKLILPGFVVYSYPAWSGAAIPALLMYTGEHNAKAIVFQYKTNSGSAPLLNELGTTFQAIPTRVGSFFQTTKEEVESMKMIRISDGDFLNSKKAAQTMSNLMVLTPLRIIKPSTDSCEKILKEFAKAWGVIGGNIEAAMYERVKEIQKILGLKPTGIIDLETRIGVKSAFPKMKPFDFFINSRMVTYMKQMNSIPK